MRFEKSFEKVVDKVGDLGQIASPRYGKRDNEKVALTEKTAQSFARDAEKNFEKIKKVVDTPKR